MSDPVAAPLAGGPERWVQVTKCLVCEDLTGMIDTTSWEMASMAAMAGCVTAVEAEIKRLEGVRDALRGEKRWRNFQ